MYGYYWEKIDVGHYWNLKGLSENLIKFAIMQKFIFK